MGEALLWMNVERGGLLDRRTMHAGLPVEHGQKVGMNVWLRQRPRGLEGEQGEPAGDECAGARRPWKPSRPPPRQTQACPAAQTSTEARERMF